MSARTVPSDNSVMPSVIPLWSTGVCILSSFITKGGDITLGEGLAGGGY